MNLVFAVGRCVSVTGCLGRGRGTEKRIPSFSLSCTLTRVIRLICCVRVNKNQLRLVFSYNMGRMEVGKVMASEKKTKQNKMFSSVKFVCLNISICRERERKELKTKEGARS